jgi:hypothetical protein
MSFEEIFNPGARHRQEELDAEKILPVPIPVDRAYIGHLEDLGVSMPGLDTHLHHAHPREGAVSNPGADDNGEPAAADSPSFTEE